MKSLLFGFLLMLTACSHADVTFDEVTIEVKKHKLTLELAESPTQRAKGLQDRKKLCGQCGMVFVFPAPRYVNFWMKDTYIPLDIAYIDSKGVILQIEQMKPLDESGVASAQKVRYAWEMNQGWFRMNQIKVGDVVKLSY